MMNKRRNVLAEKKAAKPSKTRELPKGFQAAPPIKSKKLLALLMGQEITTSGGTRSMVNGHPVLGG